MTTKLASILLLSLVAWVVFLALPSPAPALPTYFTEFSNKYPDSGTENAAFCQVCHVMPNGGEPWNSYGWAVRTLILDDVDIADALDMVEPGDADADPAGSTNITEINASTQPGWTPGRNNTWYFEDGSTTTDQDPPLIFGEYDPTAACEGDTNDDGVVSVDDLLTVLADWGGPGRGDVDGDGVTDVDDLLVVLANWGDCP